MGVVDDIKERIDLVEFISGYVPLKKAGRTYKGICPFHAEKTPSFVVFPHTQTWHCFGACGTGGDIFSFLMRREGLDFSEALRQLAQRAGISLAPATPATEASDRQRDKLLEIQRVAAQYFHHLLRQSAQGAPAREYLARRAINTETIERFQLGYALNSWDALKHHLIERGYAEEDILSAGLLVRKEGENSTYDRFRHRLMIPIRDRQGQVIGFGARALNPNDVPKYLNSPQTALFDKGATLYGLDLAIQAIRDADQAVIVEGYMDVISAHQRGYANVVAGMGTALSEAQLRQLRRLTKRLVLALDADAAGNLATLRGISLAREALERTEEPMLTPQGLVRFEGRLDVDIRIASLPTGRDPDDILRETPDAWPRLIEQALPIISFYLQTAANNYDLNTARGKSGLARQVLPLLREIEDPVEQAHYLSQLAQRIKVDERVLLAELQAMPRTAGQPARHRPAPTAASAGPTGSRRRLGLEEYVLAVALSYPEALEAANAELSALQCEPLSLNDFVHTQNRELFRLLMHWVQNQPSDAAGGVAFDQLVQQADALLYDHLCELRRQGESLPAITSSLAPSELVKRVLNLRHKCFKAEVAHLQFLQREADESGDSLEGRRYGQLAEAMIQRLLLVQRTIDSRSIISRRRQEARF